MPIWTHLLWLGVVTLGVLLLGIAKLHLLPRLGAPGRALSDAMCKAPLLDVMLFFFLQAPQIVGLVLGVVWSGESRLNPWLGALLGWATATLAQGLALIIWMRLHELAHGGWGRPHTIKRTLADILGSWGATRNTLAVWWTTLAIHVFFMIRVAEYVVYPVLTLLLRLPRIRQSDWVQVSRHKFSGLVGSDRIWCLYCDWMTGLWSLGSEMLRNVESFWCPIRFSSPEKCKNCSLDFPDVASTWVPPNGSIAQVESVLRAHYPGPGGDNSWHGHPARLTVRGQPVDPAE